MCIEELNDVISISDKKMKAKDDQDGLLPARLTFLRWLWKEPFWMATQRAVLKFSWTSQSYEEQLTVSFTSFWFYQAVDWSHRLGVCNVSKQVQWNPDFSNPQVFDPPDNSNQKSFPSPQSNAVISRTVLFLKAIFISSLGCSKKSEFRCVWGFIRRENWGRFCFYCDLSTSIQLTLSGILQFFFGQ